MKYYAITKNGSLLAIALDNPSSWNIPDTSVHEFDDKIPDLNINVWDQDTDTFKQASSMYTKLQFLNKFTMSERVAIRASVDPIVNDIMSLMDVAEYINVSDPSTIQGIQYLYSVGLLTVERMTEVLS